MLSSSGNQLEVDGLAGSTDNFILGTLRFLGGPNCGLSFSIRDGHENQLTLADAPPIPAKTGEKILLTEGCDKTFATCRGRFANSLNFRGEPYLPGNDLLTRYPGT